MIRFIDLRSADISGANFAFFDTVTDSFLEIGGSQTWVNKQDFVQDILTFGIGPKWPRESFRYLNLMPDWTINPYDKG